MDSLFIKHISKVSRIDTTFQREFGEKIHWEERLIGIKGQRGVGKTTLLLQYIHNNYKTRGASGISLYVSMDDLYFSDHKLVDLAEQFLARGGKHLFIDEVHRYPGWSGEIKNIYDDLPELNVVFTGSSLLQIRDSKGDLSRRAAFYHIPGLSFREFINFTTKKNYSKLTLKEVLANHTEFAIELKKEIKPVPLFKQYLKSGYFPFFREYPKTFLQRIEEIVNTTIDIDIMSLKGLNTSGLIKLKHLLYIIAQSVPFKPNIIKLSERIGVNRNTLLTYLKHLEDAGIILNLYSSAQGIGALQKPEKIYLENTCFNFALTGKEPETGTLRETFFFNQLKENHSVTYTEKGDFVVDGKYTFEVGGPGKTGKQLSGIKSAYFALDDIETGFEKKIPLWMFGFLY